MKTRLERIASGLKYMAGPVVDIKGCWNNERIKGFWERLKKDIDDQFDKVPEESFDAAEEFKKIQENHEA